MFIILLLLLLFKKKQATCPLLLLYSLCFLDVFFLFHFTLSGHRLFNHSDKKFY